MSRLPNAQRIAEYVLLLFMAGAILWRGGKSVDASWALGIVTIGVVFAVAWYPLLRIVGFPKDTRVPSMTVPFGLWGTLLFFLAWSALSYLTSSTRTYGLDELLRDVSCVLLFLWIVRRASNLKSSILLEGFLWIVTMSGAVATLFGLAVYVFQPVNRFVGTFLDWRFHTDYWPNAWAEFALLAWPMAALLASRSSSPFRRWLCTFATGLLLGSLFLSYSRGGFIAFVGQGICVLVFWLALLLRDVRIGKSAARRWKGVIVHAASALAFALLLFVGANALRAQRYDIQSVGDKVAFQAAEGTSSIDERAQFWEQSFRLSMERPLLGYGPYSFRFAQPHLMEQVYATSDHAHNVFLKYAAERGLPAAIAFIGFLGYVIILSIRHLFLDRKNDWSIGADARTIALLVAVLGVLAHNLIDYNLQFVGIALPLWVALALLSTHLAEKRPVSRASFSHWRLARSFSRIESAAVAFLLVVTLWEGGFLVVSSLGRHAEAVGDARTALLWYERSSFEWFSRDLLLARARLLEQQGLLDEAEEVLDASLTENSVDARAWRIRSELATRRGETELAYLYARHAYELGRYTDIGILRVLIDSGLRLEKVQNVPKENQPNLRGRKEEFDTLFRAYADAILRNTHHIALGGSVDELQTVAGQLSRLFPNDAERYVDIAADAYAHAQDEKAKSAARPVGLLW